MVARATLPPMNPVEFLAIGDTVVDDFIRLTDAKTHCRIDDDSCELCVRFGDKVPFESSTVVYGVGNAANAAVSAARLGLKSALLSHVGADDRGAKIVEYFKSEGLVTDYVEQDPNVPTNYHYVLWYESERTILVKQNEYTYTFPKDLPPPKGLYFSSINPKAIEYRQDLIAYLSAHPDIIFTFQPGVFEIKSGVEAFKGFYEHAHLMVCNKEEAERILNVEPTDDIKSLLAGLLALGPKHIIITDGRNGAYAYDGSRAFFVPMYPDPREPFERTGAGDAFASSVAAALTLGHPIEEALLWGPINSMAVVQEIGAQKGLLRKEALETYLAQAPESYRVSEI